MAWKDEGRASPKCFGEIDDVSAKHKKCNSVRPADLKPHSLEPHLDTYHRLGTLSALERWREYNRFQGN